MKVAIVYDRVNKIGGAERVLESLRELFPKSILFTSIYDRHPSLPNSNNMSVEGKIKLLITFVPEHRNKVHRH